MIDIKNMDDLAALKNDPNATSVSFASQFENLLTSGQLIFFELEDGYAVFSMRKGYGFSKPKPEVTMVSFELDTIQTYKNKDIKKSIQMFQSFHDEGTDFFYIPGIIAETVKKK